MLGVALVAFPWASRADVEAERAKEKKKWLEKHPPLSELQIYHDGKGHYVALRPRLRYKKPKENVSYRRSALYFGSRKSFRWVESSADGPAVMKANEPYVNVFYDHRFSSVRGNGTQRLERLGDTVTLRCGDIERRFVHVDEVSQKRIVSSAKQVHSPSFKREAHRFARDERGNYYYVDRNVNGADYDKRLYIGRRGRMKRIKLLDVAVDSAGELYVSKKGSLQVGADWRKATWIALDGRKKELTAVAPQNQDSLRFIHTDLGVYLGKKRGTPCDWL